MLRLNRIYYSIMFLNSFSILCDSQTTSCDPFNTSDMQNDINSL